ncbi:hypothetical protein Dimus_023268, partial [Dionaea muscipula]
EVDMKRVDKPLRRAWRPKTVAKDSLVFEKLHEVRHMGPQGGSGDANKRDQIAVCKVIVDRDADRHVSSSGILAETGLLADQGDWVVATKTIKRPGSASPRGTTTHQRFAAPEMTLDIVDRLMAQGVLNERQVQRRRQYSASNKENMTAATESL